MGDRARRNYLVLNSVCEERWKAHCQEQHLQRLQHMRPMVDTAEPPSVRMQHLNAHANPKRLEQKAERQKNIDKENRVLLEKMLKIHSTDSHQVIQPFLARTTFRLKHGHYVHPISGTRCLDHINPSCPSLYSTGTCTASTSASLYCTSPNSWNSPSSSRPGTPLRPHSGGSVRESALFRAMALETGPYGPRGPGSAMDAGGPVHGANHMIHLSTLHGPHGPGSPYFSPRAHPAKRAASCRSLRCDSPPRSYTHSAPTTPAHGDRTAPGTAPSSPLSPSRRSSTAPYAAAAAYAARLSPTALSPLSNRSLAPSGISDGFGRAPDADLLPRSACPSPRGSAGGLAQPSRLAEGTGF